MINKWQVKFLIFFIYLFIKANTQTKTDIPCYTLSHVSDTVGNDQRSIPQWAVLMAPTSLALTSQIATISFTRVTVQLSHLIGDVNTGHVFIIYATV